MKFEWNSQDLPIDKIVLDCFYKYGVGHMKDWSNFDLRKIPKDQYENILEDYEMSIAGIKKLLGSVSDMLSDLEVEQERRAILKDVLTGLEKALYRTANQFLYHATRNSEESSNAFDELNMLLVVIGKYIKQPDIERCEVIEKNTFLRFPTATYHLSTDFDEIEHRQIEAIEAYFSKNNIAWNITSKSPYRDEPLTKSGIRLDWGPVYKEEGDDGANESGKKRWNVSYDISGYNIDKIMNIYSPSGHHFPDVFDYKIGFLVPGLSKAMQNYYNKFSD